MDGIEIFIKLRDACDEVIKAYESENQAAIENAFGKFMLLMIQLECLK